MDPGATGGADLFAFAGLIGDNFTYDFRRSDGDKIEINLDDGIDWLYQRPRVMTPAGFP